ncbi:MAG: 1-deoxy-D-xylulose-5-phosphate reductoisomerase [Chloroflexota bacterium]|nr:1-deoxy-D-xylulose-5-phosphate reductoisomerase [Chloroflexota bacterium]
MGGDVKHLAVLGSTGSIGRQTLDIVRSFPERLHIAGLAAGRNVDLLRQQIQEFRPKLAAIDSADGRDKPGDLDCEIVTAEEMAAHPDVDMVVVSISGMAGLAPTLAAIRAGKSIALATKEALVAAGAIVTAEARKHGVTIMPIDSEPSAIWQCLQGEDKSIRRLILTASGGPFRKSATNEIEAVTPQQALAHPTWNMGPKVTIDSATLMNKGFEAIELSWLFETPIDKIDVLIHPQSIIHSMVEFADGSVKAQLSIPDMRFPIQYALFYPERVQNDSLPHLDFINIENGSAGSALTFEAPDMDKFPCLRLAFEASRAGGTYPAVLSAADEVAVDRFLKGQIGFMDIPRIISSVIDEHSSIAEPALDDVLAADSWARERAAR